MLIFCLISTMVFSCSSSALKCMDFLHFGKKSPVAFNQVFAKTRVFVGLATIHFLLFSIFTTVITIGYNGSVGDS